MIVPRFSRTQSKSSGNRSFGSTPAWCDNPRSKWNARQALGGIVLRAAHDRSHTAGQTISAPGTDAETSKDRPQQLEKMRSVFSSNRSASMTSSWRMRFSRRTKAIAPATGRLRETLCKLFVSGECLQFAPRRIGPPSLHDFLLRNPTRPRRKCHRLISSRSFGWISNKGWSSFRQKPIVSCILLADRGRSIWYHHSIKFELRWMDLTVLGRRRPSCRQRTSHRNPHHDRPLGRANSPPSPVGKSRGTRGIRPRPRLTGGSLYDTE